MDLTDYPVKLDWFEGMHMLPDTAEKIEAALGPHLHNRVTIQDDRVLKYISMIVRD